MSGFVDGGTFILDAPEHVPAIWGDEHGGVLWAKGESLILCGPQGVGKTTLAQQIVRARMGGAPARSLDVAGYMVTPDPEKRVLYIAADRPHQAARSMRRMFTDAHRDHLNERLLFCSGSLPFDIVAEPARLASMATFNNAGTIVIDSLKDIAPSLSNEETGFAINRAIQLCIEADVQVLVLHHQRKGNSDNKKPKTLSDVYGSGFITAGAGSVVVLWGEAGDPIVELIHLKQPADEVGPLQLRHDHAIGETTLVDSVTVWDLLQTATGEGISASDAASAFFGTKPTPAQTEKARRKLERFKEEGKATAHPQGAGRPVLYRPVLESATVRLREVLRDPLTPPSRTITNADEQGSREPHAPHAPSVTGPSSLKERGRDVSVTLDEATQSVTA